MAYPGGRTRGYGSGGYNTIPVEDIRRASLSYEMMVMKGFDKILDTITDASNQDETKPVEWLIRYTNALLKPYWEDDDDYIEEMNGLSERLNKNRAKRWTDTYFCTLLEWVELMTTKFPDLDILPEQVTTIGLGVGVVKGWKDMDAKRKAAEEGK
jgi:hypothetical protein